MSGYDDYFNKRRKMSAPVSKRSPKLKVRKAAGSFSIWMGIFASILAGGCGWFLTVGEERASNILASLEVSIFGNAEAAAKDAEPAVADKAKTAAVPSEESVIVKAPPKSWSEEEVTLFKKLDSRKKQLDEKEVELTKLEEELQSQKTELEKKLTSLETVRTSIANKLEDKVKVDNSKVDTLVSVYANMKPAQAAKVIESINEDLAVEVLTKMKNKSAAEILNLMNPDVAKKLSERFAGFREPAQAARQ
jgi:flagellar motility protein MotE (MotC chaperone)